MESERLRITLDNEDKTYFAGQTVKGEIWLNLAKRTKIRDGFPRTVVQAKKLLATEHLDAVLNLDVPNEVIIDRVKGRWIHLPSGRVYNIGFNAPKVPGKDDITGEILVQRPDDQPDIVAKRLQVYEEMMTPVLEYFEQQNLVTNFKGNTTAEIWPKIEKFLQEKTKAAVANRA